MSYLFDSNILIRSATPALGLQPLPRTPEAAVSAISQVEVLGYHGLTPAAELCFVSAFAFLEVVAVSPAIVARAVLLGRTYRLRAADAIIAATAMARDSVLLTQDGHFRNVPNLQVLNPLPTPIP